MNTEIPPHLLENLRRTQTLFPKHEVFLITNFSINLPADLRVKIFQVGINDFVSDFEAHEWDSSFRNGFWQASFMRILVLKTFHDRYPSDSILHVESDVILLPQFPFESISKLTKLHWNSFGNKADVGALIYSPSSTETAFLVSSLRLHLKVNPRATDMTALFAIRQENSDRCNVLPTSPLDQSFSSLPFIFDGAILGMWLFGQDPRNHYGYQPRFRNLSESFYALTRHSVRVHETGSLNFLECGVTAPIATLHIHCKDKRLFLQDGELLNRRIRQASKVLHLPLFRPTVLRELFVDALRERRLKGFIYNLPILGKLIRLFRFMIKAIGVFFSNSIRKGRQ